MRRLKMTPRPDWQAKAEAAGFAWHSEAGPYWDESAAYSFTLQEVEEQIEAAAGALHAMCLDLTNEVIGSERLLQRLAIPQAHWDLLLDSWRRREPSLYGRFDLRYDGFGAPALYEYNADTPTSVYEAAVFQWLWLEEGLRDGWLRGGTDQFNSLFERLRDRMTEIFGRGAFVHFAADAGSVEDRRTVDFFIDLASQAGLDARFVGMGEIGLNAEGRFVDAQGYLIKAAFKLYPWEDMLREPFAGSLARAGVRWVEPPWKAVLSNKGILPLLWERHRGHPNLLPAFFEDDPRAAELGDRYVRKPLFSREGANVELVEGGRVVEPVLDQGYGVEGFIRQAWAPPPVLQGEDGPVRPVIGAWIVGDQPAGMGVREDTSAVTKNTARFVPHVIEG
jgi:glutathionylspermidine synthase